MRTLETLAADAEPFPESLIETIPAGANKPAVDYVSWSHYNQRLLLQHPAHEYEVTDTVYGSTWAVTVHITIDGQRYGGVGEDSTSPTSAESNAYKRACAHAGIGTAPRHLPDKSCCNGKTRQLPKTGAYRVPCAFRVSAAADLCAPPSPYGLGAGDEA